MWDHVTLRASDLEASARFYDLALRTLGVERTSSADWLVEWDQFSVSPANAEKPPTRRLRIGFTAPSRGAPGPRPQYTPDYYGGVLVDPGGNSAEAVHHQDVADSRVIDLLWRRRADVDAAKASYVTIAGGAGIRLAGERPDWAHFDGPGGTLPLVPGEPTEELHMAFPAADRVGVEALHRTATGAGYRDNGGPGERPEYHPGYYGACVLDPDGNTVESVFHDRD